MILLSNVEISGFKYYLILNDLLGSQEWLLVSEIHPKNFAKVGDEQRKDRLDQSDLGKKNFKEYVVEGLKRSKKTGKSQTLKSNRIDKSLSKIIDAYIDSRDMSYPKDCISINREKDSDGIEMFTASSNGYYISFVKEDSLFKELSFSANGFTINMNENNFIKIPKKLEYLETSTKNKSIEIASLPNMSVDVLSSLIDLSWYRDPVTLKKKKEYVSALNLVEFESKVVTPMIKHMHRLIEMGERPLLSCDTETDGIKLYCLEDDNPDKSFVCSIQFSWRDNQGAIVYLNMAYHDNVNKEYVMNRFKKLFDYGVRTPSSSIELIYDEFGNKLDESIVYNFNRKDYDLVGHNTIFDSRATLSEGAQYYFDHDTLQMAFNIDPTTVKGSKKLKNLTKVFLGDETPELADIAGKGNEDKFRYLKDVEITEIYGCADVDYTRQIYFFLRKLMSDKMFKSYKALDPITWYLCARSEYYGLRLEGEGLRKDKERIKKDIDKVVNFIYSYVGHIVTTRAKLKAKGLDPSFLTTESSEVDSLSAEEFLDNSKVNKYEFKLRGAGLRKVMYNLLEYPVKVRTKKSGAPAVNVDAFNKLLYYTNDSGVKLMKSDLVSDDGKTILVSADKFNSYKYPLCYLLKINSALDKEYTTYYEGFDREDLEGRLFKSISTTNIETRRFSSAAQIIKKSLKSLILPSFEDYYLADWDFDQIEARKFISDAKDEVGIEKFKDNEKDYHTENAALMFVLEPHLVPSDSRSKAKAIGFGLPYGLSDYKLEERLFTVHSKENAAKTIELRMKFEHANKKCMSHLENIRSKAIEPVEVPVELKRFWRLPDDAKIGMIKNNHGFYRYFNISDVLGDKKAEASKGRQAGNFPIQSMSADIFRFALKRLYDRLIREGLDDKVIFNMYIHDELLFSVHKSVDFRRIAKICAEECMFRLKGETSYFIGLAFGNNWLECKKDCNEMPSGLLNEIKKTYDASEDLEWCDNACESAKPMIVDYKYRRIMSILNSINPNFEDNLIDIKTTIDKFTNYKVRGYIYDYGTCYKVDTFLNSENRKVSDDNDVFTSSLCSMFVKHDQGNIKLMVDGKVFTVTEYIEFRKSMEEDKSESSSTELDNDSILSFEDDLYDFIEEEFWSLDDEDEDEVSAHVISMYDYEEESTFTFELPKHSHKYVRPSGKDVVLNCRRPKHVAGLKDLVAQYKSVGGKRIVIETIVGSEAMPGKYDINFDTIDNYLKEVN